MNFLNYLWVPMLIVTCMISAYASKLSNIRAPHGTLYVFLTSILSVFLWMAVSKLSKNLLFDSLLYDIILTIVFSASFIYLQCSPNFTTLNWIGVAITIFGLILMKI